jgi:hypothetical protein
MLKEDDDIELIEKMREEKNILKKILAEVVRVKTTKKNWKIVFRVTSVVHFKNLTSQIDRKYR